MTNPSTTGNLASDLPRRPWTVQCGYAAYYANTVVVDAATAEEACALAIEKANGSDGWRSVDRSGDTFVDALAPGEGVNPWSPAARSVEPVPERFTEAGAIPGMTVVCVAGEPHHARVKDGVVRVLVQRLGPTSLPELLDPVLIQLPAIRRADPG